MNNKLKAALIASVLWGASSLTASAFASCLTGACTNVTIEELYVSGVIYIRTSGDETQLNCDDGAQVTVTLQLDHPGVKEIYAMLLSAMKSGEPVYKIRITEGTSNCKVAYVVDRPE